MEGFFHCISFIFRIMAPQILASLSAPRFLQTAICLFVLILVSFNGFLTEESNTS